MYTITDLSKMFHLSASTLRYYEKIGLLENVNHKDRYHRTYDQSHIDQLKAIECFKQALLPLSEIKAFFEYEKNIASNAGMMLDMMKEQEKHTLEAIKDLKIGLAHIQKKIRYYTLVKDAVESRNEIPLWEDIK